MFRRNDIHNPDGEKDSLTGRAAKLSAFVYLGLAVTVVVVATVGIFSVSYDYEESLPDVSFPEINYDPDGDLSVPQINIKPDTSVPDKPVGNEQSGITGDVSEPEPQNVFYSPVSGEIIREYSMDKLVFSETMGDYRVHSGIDIEAEVGADVISFGDGVVASITNDYFYGTTLAITHDNGVVSYYMNLDPTLAENIAVGSEVDAGQKIGTVGTSARCEAMEDGHLHFELRVDGKLIDPTNELP